MTQLIVWADVFGDRFCGGNPAAVCLLDCPAPAAAMQALASEMGSSDRVRLARGECLLASFDNGQVEVEVPAESPAACDPPPLLAERWPVVAAATGRFDLLVELDDAGAVLSASEDPVTGSAQCLLGPCWARLFGQNRLRARQLSSRGGAMVVHADDRTVRVGGRVVTIFSGELSHEIAATLGARS